MCFFTAFSVCLNREIDFELMKFLKINEHYLVALQQYFMPIHKLLAIHIKNILNSKPCKKLAVWQILSRFTHKISPTICLFKRAPLYSEQNFNYYLGIQHSIMTLI